MSKRVYILVLSILMLACSCEENAKPINTKEPDDIIFSKVDEGEGKSVFERNCSSCHHLFKKSTGPALSYIMKVRNETWFFDFLSDLDINRDSLNKNLEKEFGFYCMRPTNLSRNDIAHLYKYLTSPPTGCVR